MTTRLFESECLGCGKLLGAAADPTDDDAVPEPGDITICIGCGYLMVFADDLTFREIREDEILEVPLDQVSRLQRALTTLINVPNVDSVKK